VPSWSMPMVARLFPKSSINSKCLARTTSGTTWGFGCSRRPCAATPPRIPETNASVTVARRENLERAIEIRTSGYLIPEGGHSFQLNLENADKFAALLGPHAATPREDPGGASAI